MIYFTEKFYAAKPFIFNPKKLFSHIMKVKNSVLATLDTGDTITITLKSSKKNLLKYKKVLEKLISDGFLSRTNLFPPNLYTPPTKWEQFNQTLRIIKYRIKGMIAVARGEEWY